jgi:hypothetical protein
MRRSHRPDFRQLDDPELIAERARVRERLEHVPEQSADHAALAGLYADMTAEFDRRVRHAWTAPGHTEGNPR